MKVQPKFPRVKDCQHFFEYSYDFMRELRGFGISISSVIELYEAYLKDYPENRENKLEAPSKYNRIYGIYDIYEKKYGLDITDGIPEDEVDKHVIFPTQLIDFVKEELEKDTDDDINDNINVSVLLDIRKIQRENCIQKINIS
jgi:hypothetical protein